jgi:hypothetical protein
MILPVQLPPHRREGMSRNPACGIFTLRGR